MLLGVRDWLLVSGFFRGGRAISLSGVVWAWKYISICVYTYMVLHGIWVFSVRVCAQCVLVFAGLALVFFVEVALFLSRTRG